MDFVWFAADEATAQGARNEEPRSEEARLLAGEDKSSEEAGLLAGEDKRPEEVDVESQQLVAATKQEVPELERNHHAVGFLEAWRIPGVATFALCLFFSKLVAYTFLYWLPFYIRQTRGFYIFPRALHLFMALSVAWLQRKFYAQVFNEALLDSHCRGNLG